MFLRECQKTKLSQLRTILDFCRLYSSKTEIENAPQYKAAKIDSFVKAGRISVYPHFEVQRLVDFPDNELNSQTSAIFIFRQPTV